MFRMGLRQKYRNRYVDKYRKFPEFFSVKKQKEMGLDKLLLAL